MSPKSRSAEHRSSALGLDLVAVRSEIVVLKWCSPYYQTPSKKFICRILHTPGPMGQKRPIAPLQYRTLNPTSCDAA
jgi:hypothetical protein